MPALDTFTEYEAYAESIEDVDLRLTLARLERPRFSIAHVALGDAMHVQAASEGSGCIADGSSRPDGIVVYMQRSTDLGVANGATLGPSSAFVMPPGSEFYIVGGGANDWASIFVPNEVAASRDLPTSGDACVLEAGRAARALWNTISRMIAAHDTEPAAVRERASRAAIEELLLGHLESVCGSRVDRAMRPRGRRRVADRRLVSLAVDMIECGPDRIATVEELVAATGVHERTLRDGFQKFLGISPRRYIQLSRLHEARRRLTDPRHDAVTVTQIASSVGMWDFGRFAERYRKAFGELPSQTLARATGRAVD